MCVYVFNTVYENADFIYEKTLVRLKCKVHGNINLVKLVGFSEFRKIYIVKMESEIKDFHQSLRKINIFTRKIIVLRTHPFHTISTAKKKLQAC